MQLMNVSASVVAKDCHGRMVEVVTSKKKIVSGCSQLKVESAKSYTLRVVDLFTFSHSGK